MSAAPAKNAAKDAKGGHGGHDHDDDDHPPHEEHAEAHGDEEPWLMSFADLMTLLFGFFAMLFTFATFEEEDTVKMHKQVAKYFGGTYVAPAQKLADNIKFEFGKTPYVNDMDLKLVDDGVEITFITSVLFTSGNANLVPEALEPMHILIDLIKSTAKDYVVRVEGHTDDAPIPAGSSKFPTNWELSAARAATIVRLFESSGFSSDLLAATGYGHARPAYPNRDQEGQPIPENMAHNRRVVIKVIMPKVPKTDGKDGADPKAAKDPKGEGGEPAAEAGHH